ncbi:toll/interleukin-1 receptor domain-containing protein [Polyangium spumosum]|uniref:TIR domain-containing protein n=1 Tax=Polyangium spumosum TaxID=889282 RepID=A0A6N7QBF0_9BACT|nr:toll/interleukin-1 receptor domain-containing protein [Polyangium spumosum]MRG98181.1 TIR domain-containing protein [Polyangium spumosum]
MIAKPPTVFVSYAWEDDVKVWVRDFATRLRREGGVDVHIDQWHLAPGDPLPAFMENAVRTNDFVLLVCTPKYKAKSDARQGGVGYEGNIITGEVFAKANHRKFIPILRKGDWSSAAPSFLLGNVYIDFRGDPYTESAYKDLLNTLHGRLERPPTLGLAPASSGEIPGASGASPKPIAHGIAARSATSNRAQLVPAKNGAPIFGVKRTVIGTLIVCLLALAAAFIGLSKLLSPSPSTQTDSKPMVPSPSTQAEQLGQPERGWIEAYGAAIDSGDVDRIIALHVLPTRRFFTARNQDATQLRKLYQGWFDGDGRTKRTGFDNCSLATVASDGARALRCETYVEPPFSKSPSRVPTCLVFRSDGKLLSRTEISKGNDCPPH